MLVVVVVVTVTVLVPQYLTCSPPIRWWVARQPSGDAVC